jgi:Ca2+-binding EF-hand superfamily protein
MRKNKINLLQNFSISLLARIQHLVEIKHRNLLEAFKEEDQYNTGFADLKQLKNSLEKFGLHNIKKHEIKTLVKVFKSDVNYLNPEEEEEEESISNKSNTLSLNGFDDMSDLEKEKDPKKKKFDIENPNFKVDYKEFADKIYEEIENNNKLFKGSYQVLRKVYNMAKMKPLTLFEVFVYFDVNNLNSISNMELRLGLQNLEISLEKYEMDNLWNVFEKNADNKVSFNSFLEAFINASCFEVIKFDDKVKNLLKRFTFLITKHGNYEELFRKLDMKGMGYITLDVFKLKFDFQRTLLP